MNKKQEKELLNMDMELTVEGLGQTLKVIGNSLYIGNEYSENKVSEVFCEDILKAENKELIEKLKELNRLVSEACIEVKGMTLGDRSIDKAS